MISPRSIKKDFAGKSFEVINQQSGNPIKFSFPSVFENWPRRGGEGIVVPVTCHHPSKGDIPSILKCFDLVAKERGHRQKHLLGFGLASAHDWLYQGVPYSWIDKEILGHRVYGHVAKHVGVDGDGDDFRIVRSQDKMDFFSAAQRRECAAQLCCAVAGLENLGLVHGDLSPANIVLTKKDDDSVSCILIDFDGFHGIGVPVLPREVDGRVMRMFGSPGYQHPTLMRAIAAENKQVRNDDLIVESDRYALAVLCFELVTWTTAIAEEMTDNVMLDHEKLGNGVLDVPEAAKASWKAGYELLNKATNARYPDELPSPEDWLDNLGFQNSITSAREEWKDQSPKIRILRVHGNATPKLVREVNFTNESGSTGSFGVVDERLRQYTYGYSHDNGAFNSVWFSADTGNKVLLQRDRRTKMLGENPGKIIVRKGDVCLTDNWKFEIY